MPVPSLNCDRATIHKFKGHFVIYSHLSGRADGLARHAVDVGLFVVVHAESYSEMSTLSAVHNQLCSCQWVHCFTLTHLVNLGHQAAHSYVILMAESEENLNEKIEG